MTGPLARGKTSGNLALAGSWGLAESLALPLEARVIEFKLNANRIVRSRRKPWRPWQFYDNFLSTLGAILSLNPTNI